jgi:uncharacterized protein (DUF1501 family)
VIDRRRFLSLAFAGGALLIAPRIVFATVETDRRFIFIIQRGAADGLHIVSPYADPDYAKMRGAMAVDPATATKLDGSFALHPALAETAKMYNAGEALFVHAIASPYRERSHFDGQNVIETGSSAPYQVKDGWLNRLSTLLPKGKAPPIALTPTVPMALRGASEVTSYSPSPLREANADLLARVSRLYQNDTLLHPLWSAAMETRRTAGDHGSAAQEPANVGKLAASFLARADGPRIAMIETIGWDTHNQQEPRLARLLAGFDAMLAALRTGMGQSWTKTTVLVATEFGRTVAVNGTNGTDHGTGTAAMLIGGAVKGGRVLANWPGLSQSTLYENRDLKATMALDALIAGAAGESFVIDPELVARTVFKDGSGGKPITGLIRS